MGIGGALATARSEAGLTVDQVSERTRIRRALIRAIEQDDYAPCGGDFYARGHIRAIAQVVGADPVPLIEEYDETHGLRRAPHLEPGEGDPAPTVTTASPGYARPDDTGRARPGGITAAEAFGPAMPLKIGGTRRLPVRVGLLVVVGAALIAVIAYLLASLGSAPAPTGRSHAAARTVRHPVAPAPVKSQAIASPAPTSLPVTSAVAFGPAGPGQGDYPQGAPFAVDGNAATAWHTDWYAAANLNGQPGTGLLLDLGTTVTVSSVQLGLGPAAGGTVELRAGSAPTFTSLPVVAQATIPGGTFALQMTAPAAARYLLVWFTQLPPDGTGTFQAFVYNVSVSGTS